jgi:hypothetical protein
MSRDDARAQGDEHEGRDDRQQPHDHDVLHEHGATNVTLDATSIAKTYGG